MVEWSLRSVVFARVNAAVLAVATAVAAFDTRLFAIRIATNVMPDALVHYNILLTWWRHGDSLRGYTLTPSPYFIDLLLQLPLALLAPDFEQFSYALALCYFALISAAMYLVLRVVLAGGAIIALLVTCAVMAAFYTWTPHNFVLHAFIVNHTSEVFTTLGLLALVHAWFAPGARRRWYAPYAYALLVAICVASSPFFIATYCIPGTLAAATLLGTARFDLQRFAKFVGLTAIGAIAGLIAIALVSRYVWPVRVDSYQRWWKSYLAFKHSIATEPGAIAVAGAAIVACIASVVLVVVGRRRGWASPVLFALAFIPAATLACVAMPIKRGAFDGNYAFRYFQLPVLLAVAFHVVVVAQLLRLVIRRHGPRLRRAWLPWTCAVLGVTGVLQLARCHGSLTMDDDRSLVSPMIQCFRDVDHRGDLEDGLSTWYFGRYFTAARHAWGAEHVIVNVLGDGRIDPWDNNVGWFADGFRGERGRLNFLVTYALDDEFLRALRDRVGAPDRTISCPIPANHGFYGPPTFELWIWDRAAAKQRLTSMLLADNLRSPFSPVVGATRMQIDPMWGMDSASTAGELRQDRRIWHRVNPGSTDPAISIRPMFLPSGAYRIELDVVATARAGDAGPVFDIQVTQYRHGELARIEIARGTRPAAIEFDVGNYSGPTSGAAITIHLVPRSADTLEVSGATLTLIEQHGVSPFQIFH